MPEFLRQFCALALHRGFPTLQSLMYYILPACILMCALIYLSVMKYENTEDGFRNQIGLLFSDDHFKIERGTCDGASFKRKWAWKHRNL